MNKLSRNDIPMCDVMEQYRQLKEEMDAAVLRVLASGQAILGPEVTALENEIAEYSGSNHAIGCGSGTDALLLALMALDIGMGDEVIVPPFTFFATASCVHRLGAKVVFADIDPLSYNIDPKQIENKITPQTKAIIPVHLYGQCADMDAIRAIAKKYQIAIIEDAAQAIGAEYRGQKAGTMSDIGCFSFYPSKNLGAFGDAGMVVTQSESLAKKLRALRVHGMEPRYYHHYVGLNERLDAIHAAMLRVKLPHLERWTKGRIEVANRYDEYIHAARLDSILSKPTRLPDRRCVFHQYVVRTPTNLRDGLVQHLKQNGVSCDIYYPLPLHLQPCFQSLGYRKGDFPISELASESVLAFPMYPELTSVQQMRVIDTCAQFIHKGRVAA